MGQKIDLKNIKEQSQYENSLKLVISRLGLHSAYQVQLTNTFKSLKEVELCMPSLGSIQQVRKLRQEILYSATDVIFPPVTDVRIHINIKGKTFKELFIQFGNFLTKADKLTRASMFN